MSASRSSPGGAGATESGGEPRGGPSRPRSIVDWGREICGTLATAESREWLCVNGIGGFASGTVAGMLTRRYHGLLMAALKPPLGRTLLVAKVDDTIEYDDLVRPLFANHWGNGSVDPHGYREIERFHLEGTTPVWTYACADALLEKRVWMEHGANTTYVRYRLTRAVKPAALSVKALVNYRDYHAGGAAGAGPARHRP
jgi:predicted glycogen debranching enzyme